MSRVLKSAANTLVNRTASRKFPRHVFALVGAAILISACGGNSSSDLAIDSSSEGASGGSVVQVQSDDNCLPTATNDCSGGGSSDIVRLFAEGAATVASIAAGESHRYAVPAGSQVVLSSLSGNADLYCILSRTLLTTTLCARQPLPMSMTSVAPTMCLARLNTQ